MRNGSRGNSFFRGVIFRRKHGSYRNLFSGMGLFYIFSGFDHRVCYQNSKNEPCIFIYIHRSCFWKINRDNNQWVSYHQLSAKYSRSAVIIFVYSAGHLLRTEIPLLRTNIITLRQKTHYLEQISLHLEQKTHYLEHMLLYTFCSKCFGSK